MPCKSINDLTDLELNLLVALTQGAATLPDRPYGYLFLADGTYFDYNALNYKPSTDWSIGGPLLEKHTDIHVTRVGLPGDEKGFRAVTSLDTNPGVPYSGLPCVVRGETYLKAFCKALVLQMFYYNEGESLYDVVLPNFFPTEACQPQQLELELTNSTTSEILA